MVEKRRSDYIRLKEPKDVLAYVQRLINKLRREGLEMEELGRITYLLNTWISSFKAHIEFTELKELKESVARLEEELKKDKKGR
jgi:hypothetical protein